MFENGVLVGSIVMVGRSVLVAVGILATMVSAAAVWMTETTCVGSAVAASGVQDESAKNTSNRKLKAIFRWDGFLMWMFLVIFIILRTVYRSAKIIPAVRLPSSTAKLVPRSHG